ncbi:lipocalin family protein [Jannaschia marina]|uniref:lipocalin family protein n=1 Tax=Jannaschia marina TaxID=2741674 RepID=UPI0015CBC4F4|nr:lipocalin family protein [Jannaschia marina]
MKTARAVLPLLVLLTACGTASITTRPTWRDPRVPIASKADFDARAFAGSWHEVARLPGTPGCAGARLTVAAEGTGLARRTACPTGAATTDRLDVAPLGRLEGPDGPLWVLWTDTGYRTAIVVAPDGTAGQILDRSPMLPADRRRAALEVLDFNGFDTAALIYSQPNSQALSTRFE